MLILMRGMMQSLAVTPDGKQGSSRPRHLALSHTQNCQWSSHLLSQEKRRGGPLCCIRAGGEGVGCAAAAAVSLHAPLRDKYVEPGEGKLDTPACSSVDELMRLVLVASLVQRELLVRVGDALVLGDDLAAALEEPARGKEPLDPHGAPRMDAARADADLGAQAEPEAVREARRGVVVDAGAVDAAEKVLGGLLVLGHDALGVAGPEAVDVVDGLLHVAHDLDRHVAGAVLVAVRGGEGHRGIEGGADRADIAAVGGDSRCLRAQGWEGEGTSDRAAAPSRGI